MASFKTIISFITLLSLLHIHHTTAVKGGYWSEEDAITAPNIDSTLFTHLFCAFANLNTQTYQITVHPECSTFPNIIKQKNPSVKALLCIGGGKAKSSDYNTMASQPSTRKTFIDSAINQALAYGYDGLDLDWEQQTTVEEMNNYGILLNEWRAAIKARSLPLLLTAAVHYIPDANSVARFPIQAITQNLDFINVMAYDFYGPRYAPKPLVTRPHAPLRNPQSPVSGSNGISKWISAGVPAKMLVLGIPFYGYAWKLENGDNNGILAASIGGDTSFGEDGTPTYKQIRDFISEKGAIVKYNSSYVTNYCYFGTTWIVYDDLEAISGKVGYVKSNGLLGYFAWNIVQDSNWALSKQASQTWGA